VRTLLDEAATVAPGSDGLVVVPRLYPERAPSWDPTLTGEVSGFTARHGRGHLVRAAVEGVAAQLAEVLVSIESATGPVREIRATGGAFAHPLWHDVVGRAFGRDLVLVDDGHGTARGAARLARAPFAP
jgi:gluconokinase